MSEEEKEPTDAQMDEHISAEMGLEPQTEAPAEEPAEEPKEEPKEEPTEDKVETPETEEKTEEEPSEDNQDTPETPENDFLGLKKMVGRVPSIQSKTDKLASEQSKLTEEMAKLREALTPKEETKSEEIVEGLTGDNAQEFFKKQVQLAVDERIGAIEQKYNALQEKQEQADYMLNIQEYAEKNGHETDKFLEAASKLAGAIADGAAEGNPAALQKQSLAQSNSEYLALLTEKYLSQQVQEKAKKVEQAKDALADVSAPPKSESRGEAPKRENLEDFSDDEIMSVFGK